MYKFNSTHSKKNSGFVPACYLHSINVMYGKSYTRRERTRDIWQAADRAARKRAQSAATPQMAGAQV